MFDSWKTNLVLELEQGNFEEYNLDIKLSQQVFWNTNTINGYLRRYVGYMYVKWKAAEREHSHA